MKIFLASSIIGVLCVSASGQIDESKAVTASVEWRAFEGPQPILRFGSGKSVDVTYIRPVYWDYPARVYHIIGDVAVHGNYFGKTAAEKIEPSLISSLATAAKAHGADAIIMQPLSEKDRALTRSDGQPMLYAWAWAIKWGAPPL